MTVRTRAQLNSDADSYLADNTIGDISPGDVRQRVKDLADSSRLMEDDIVESVVAGSGVAVDNTDPANPVISASAVVHSTSQPTSDIAASGSLALTGLSAYQRVDARWMFELVHSAGSAGTRTVTLTARVSGGTKRTLATFTTPSLTSGQKVLFAGEVSISGFNASGNEKVVRVSGGFSIAGTTLDSSNAINSVTNGGDTFVLATWNEVWDEISLDLGTNVVLAGTTTDERGRLYTHGFA